MKLLTADTKVAQLNGTLYIYGGQAITSADQKSNAWSKCDTPFHC